MNIEDRILEYKRRTDHALSMGGEAKLAKRRAEGRLNARERVALLFDEGTFGESGLHATSAVPADRDRTPADGKVCGVGRVEGRNAAVVAYDFTVKGASSSVVSNKKMQHMKDLGARAGMPVVYLNESTGVRMPDIMGGTGMGKGNDKTRFLRRRESPWAAAVFGYAFGSAAWHTVCSDFAVFVKGSVMAVSSPGLVRMATRQEVDEEELGGWKHHASITGYADAVADDDAHAVRLIRRFLSYLPSHCDEPAPRAAVPAEDADRASRLLDILPEEPNRVYDVRKVVADIADTGSMLELKGRFGRNAMTALCRINGRSVGVIANNPMFKGGAIDADAADKITSFLVLCDSFNIPIVFMVDQPGFLIGLQAERRRMAGRIINWMNALSLVTVPKITIVMRKSYGQAYVNMGGAETADTVAAWHTAEIGFMQPSSAVEVVHGISRDDDPDAFDGRLADMARGDTAYDAASVYGVHDVIDPRDTRGYIDRMLGIHADGRSGGVGEHLLGNWPTSY